MEQSEEEQRAAAKRRVQARSSFIVHLLMYVVGSVGAIVIWALTGARYPWFLWVLLGWGVAVVAHGVVEAIGPDSAREQRAIERELGRLRSTQQPH